MLSTNIFPFCKGISPVKIFNKVLLTSPYNAIIKLNESLRNPDIDYGVDYKTQGLKILAQNIGLILAIPTKFEPENNLYFLRGNNLENIGKTSGDINNWYDIGKQRFDTKIVRNVIWLVTLQLVMRHTITKHLSWIDTPVIRGLKLLDKKTTEFIGTKSLNDKEFDDGDYDNILE